MQVPVELKIKYLSRRIIEIQKLRASIDQDDYSLAAKVGHQIKGNAVTFDVPQIAFIGLEMEKAASKRDKEKVRHLVARMETVILLAQTAII